VVVTSDQFSRFSVPKILAYANMMIPRITINTVDRAAATLNCWFVRYESWIAWPIV